MSDIQAIETRYNGYRFRSRLEARWAVYFDHLKVKYEYEQQGFELPSGKYLPDFFLPEVGRYVEIKPPATDRLHHHLYLCGKMTYWRGSVDLNGHNTTGPSETCKHDSRGLHGAFWESHRKDIVLSCMEGIHKCTAMMCWIDHLDTFASLVEIGFAHAKGKPIFCAVASALRPLIEEKSNSTEPSDSHDSGMRLHDFWFIESISNEFGFFARPQDAINLWFPRSPDEQLCAELASGGKEVYLFRGDPVGGVMTLFTNGQEARRILVHQAYYGKEISPEAMREAALMARGARFEHGECGDK